MKSNEGANIMKKTLWKSIMNNKMTSMILWCFWIYFLQTRVLLILTFYPENERLYYARVDVHFAKRLFAARKETTD